MCEALYTQGNVTPPHYAYRHGQPVSNEACATGNGSSIAGLAFYQTANWKLPGRV